MRIIKKTHWKYTTNRFNCGLSEERLDEDYDNEQYDEAFESDDFDEVFREFLIEDRLLAA
ncbi:MAG: hypothetical protein ACK4NY_06335 [Spirosomataceae bacterium]